MGGNGCGDHRRVGLALVLALFVAPVTAVMAGCFSTTSPR
jgi:uncharacterized protein involved in cysteine biosynthesis